MDETKKIKIALDESRTLILGAQILLGFQLQVPFQDGFAAASVPERIAETAALALMVLTLGLLIAPSAYHRIVADGDAAPEMDRLVTRLTAVTLAPFALALALGLGLAAGRIGGGPPAVAAAVIGAAAALTLWYGPAWSAWNKESAMPEQTLSPGAQPGGSLAEAAGAHHRRGEGGKAALGKKIDYVLTEARVILPGAQALLGFQLIIVFTRAFEQLPAPAQLIHGLALGLVAAATAVLITPAAWHRIVYGGREAESFHKLASRLLLLATVLLALGLGADVHVVVLKATGQPLLAAGLALAAAAVLLALWHVWPWWRRNHWSGSPLREGAR